MATFPTINRRGSELHNPVVGDFEDTMAHDPTIRSLSEGGYVTSRARFTRIARKWTIHYTWLTETNMNTIKDFETARKGGAESFSWTNPEDNTVYAVRFLGMVEFAAHPNTNFLFFIADFVLEEV